MRAIFAVLLIICSLVVLEFARSEVRISQRDIGQTPVTEYSKLDADGPVVVVAHGFAGSQQMMQGYALPLARAGYRVFVFEFLGHGRHPQPMSGDVTKVDGTTRLLVEQTAEVIDAVAVTNSKVALLGHSMATDVLARVEKTRSDVGPVVLISAFSEVIDATTPERLLLISGAWEPRLRAFAQQAVEMVDPRNIEGETVRNGAVQRRAVVAPFVEHVSVLHSRAGRYEALKWIDAAYGRTSALTILPTGWAILGLLAGLVLLFRPISSYLPRQSNPALTLNRMKIAAVLIGPAIVTPLLAVPLNPSFLPVLVADYLALHLFIFGTLQIALLWFWGVSFGRISWAALCLLLVWSGIFGFALDRYAANFWPTSQRLWIIAIILAGALPYMVTDSLLTTNASTLGRVLTRTVFLLSLMAAVALDFEGLFFLILIAPVLVLFYLVFGTMGRHAALRAGPLSSGLVLGLVLAWALGVSFPLFQS